jgi:hypothetical protein
MEPHKLEDVSSAKYLGAHLSNNLTWNKHINQVVMKSSKVLVLTKRNIKISSPTIIKATANKSLVRPRLEYSAAIWDPHTQKNIDKVEMVQQRAVRWALNRYHNTSSVMDMLQSLSWPILQLRRFEV